jgi:ABC-type transport system substrate-binding protein
MHDLAEAKKLLAAAGYASGVPVIANYISGTQLGTDFQKRVSVLEAMATEAGFQTTPNLIDYASQYTKYRDGRGKFDGLGFVSTPAPGNDAVTLLNYRYWSKGGVNFLGYDSAGKGDDSGDPQVDSMIEKAQAEVDVEKRKALIFEIQRYLAKAQYCLPNPGVAGGFTLAWPVLSNFNVYQGEKKGVNFDWWIDETKAPINRA